MKRIALLTLVLLALPFGVRGQAWESKFYDYMHPVLLDGAESYHIELFGNGECANRHYCNQCDTITAISDTGGLLEKVQHKHDCIFLRVRTFLAKLDAFKPESEGGE